MWRTNSANFLRKNTGGTAALRGNERLHHGNVNFLTAPQSIALLFSDIPVCCNPWRVTGKCRKSGNIDNAPDSNGKYRSQNGTVRHDSMLLFVQVRVPPADGMPERVKRNRTRNTDECRQICRICSAQFRIHSGLLLVTLSTPFSRCFRNSSSLSMVQASTSVLTA